MTCHTAAASIRRAQVSGGLEPTVQTVGSIGSALSERQELAVSRAH